MPLSPKAIPLIRARFQMHWDSKILLKYPLREAIHLFHSLQIIENLIFRIQNISCTIWKQGHKFLSIFIILLYHKSVSPLQLYKLSEINNGLYNIYTYKSVGNTAIQYFLSIRHSRIVLCYCFNSSMPNSGKISVEALSMISHGKMYSTINNSCIILYWKKYKLEAQHWAI
jgi:hypothetical protein